jgi:EpsD family peptidyl-prolyl cis-trans isomerase
MITSSLRLGLLAAGLICLSGCGEDKAAAAPKGQVVATADGMEITQRELAAEMDLMTGAAAEDSDKAREAALQQIIARKLLAREARARKLDDSPDFGLLKQRAEETVLEAMLQRAMTRNLPAPTSEDARRYMADNPDLFAQRKLFSVEQIRVPLARGQALIDKLKPLTSLQDVEALFAREAVQFQRDMGTLDAMQSPPELVKQMLALPTGEIFILPLQNSLTVNRIIEIRTAPVDEGEAERFALRYLRQKGISDTLKNQLAEVMKKHKDKIRYQRGFGPAVAEASREARGAGG